MKLLDVPSVKKLVRVFLLVLLSSVMIISCYAYHNFTTFKSINVTVKKTATVEYGSANYDIKKLIKEVDGEIVSVKQDIDTKLLGAQEVILEVKKDNMVKDVPVVISVVDSVAPVISLKNESVKITEGDDYDLKENISSVNDEIDGNLEFNDNPTVNSMKYYDVRYEGDLNSVGSHEITVVAMDSSGNTSTQKFTLEVEEKPVYYPVQHGAPANPKGNDVVSIAYSLLGMPYIYNSAGPYGFDCSGFVSYVYSCVGRSVGRSTYSQQYEGTGVSYSEIQPGDVIIWGYAEGSPTHSALYVGGGQMIHAANPGTGVIVSDVNFWLSGSGTHILTVRRFQ